MQTFPNVSGLTALELTPGETYTIGTSVVLPANMRLIPRGATIRIDSGGSLKLDNTFIDALEGTIFHLNGGSITGDSSLANGTIYVDWFVHDRTHDQCFQGTRTAIRLARPGDDSSLVCKPVIFGHGDYYFDQDSPLYTQPVGQYQGAVYRGKGTLATRLNLRARTNSADLYFYNNPLDQATAYSTSVEHMTLRTDPASEYPYRTNGFNIGCNYAWWITAVRMEMHGTLWRTVGSVLGSEVRHINCYLATLTAVVFMNNQQAVNWSFVNTDVAVYAIDHDAYAFDVSVGGHIEWTNGSVALSEGTGVTWKSGILRCRTLGAFAGYGHKFAMTNINIEFYGGHSILATFDDLPWSNLNFFAQRCKFFPINSLDSILIRKAPRGTMFSFQDCDSHGPWKIETNIDNGDPHNEGVELRSNFHILDNILSIGTRSWADTDNTGLRPRSVVTTAPNMTTGLSAGPSVTIGGVTLTPEYVRTITLNAIGGGRRHADIVSTLYTDIAQTTNAVAPSLVPTGAGAQFFMLSLPPTALNAVVGLRTAKNGGHNSSVDLKVWDPTRTTLLASRTGMTAQDANAGAEVRYEVPNSCFYSPRQTFLLELATGASLVYPPSVFASYD